MTKNKIFFFLLSVVILGAVFVRCYKFDDYLHFKWDQARDLFYVAEAVDNGPGSLPLLGPRAVKMEVDGERQQLRLGPGYFYLQYFFSILTNSQQPSKIAYLELFSSLASLVVLFFFCRLFWSKWYSLAATGLYAFSLMAIQFSRFAWNPNSLPLLSLICYYSVVKFFRVKEFKKRLLWFGVWSLSFAIAGQLHYMGLFLISVISGFYVLFKVLSNDKKEFPKILFKEFPKNLLYPVVFLVLFVFINLPLIFAEIAYDGENTRNLFPAFTAKSEDSNFKGKLIKNFKIHGDKYFTILTGVYFEKDDFNFNIFYIGFFGSLIYSASLIFVYRNGKAKDKELAVFLLMSFWAYFVFTIPIAYKHYIRYFLVIFPLPFISLILVVKYFFEESKSKYRYLIWGLPLIVLALNGYKTFRWFGELSGVQKDNTPYYKESSPIKNRGKDDVTLKQMQRVVNYIYEEKSEENLLTFYSSPDYKISFQYLFYLLDKNLITDHSEVKSDDPISQYYFFISDKGKELKDIPPNFYKKGKLIKRAVSGQLIVYKFKLNQSYSDSQVNAFIQEEKNKKKIRTHYKINLSDFFNGGYEK